MYIYNTFSYKMQLIHTQQDVAKIVRIKAVT